jgi:hypothetical protein
MTQYSPGMGMDRSGTYVANDGAFTKGSFGNVRIHLDVDKDKLASSPEMKQLGRHNVDDVLNTENGAVTMGRVPKQAITKVEVYDGSTHKWRSYTGEQYLNSVGIDPNTPKLPTVGTYERTLQGVSGKLGLTQGAVADLVADYNSAPLDEKLFLAEEMDLLS